MIKRYKNGFQLFEQEGRVLGNYKNLESAQKAARKYDVSGEFVRR